MIMFIFGHKNREIVTFNMTNMPYSKINDPIPFFTSDIFMLNLKSQLFQFYYISVVYFFTSKFHFQSLQALGKEKGNKLDRLLTDI